MAKVLIVGSGASGVHFALSLLKKNYQVSLLDVGYRKPEDMYLDKSCNELKYYLKDPAEYFLGKKYESIIYPNHGSEYYGFPPN